MFKSWGKLGIKGGLKPKWDTNPCTYCGVCKAVCPVKAIEVNKDSKELKFDESKCIYCGKCTKSCPTDAWNGQSGYITSFGGLYGNTITFGENLLPLIADKETLFKVIDATIEFFKKNANTGERFRFTLDRIGVDKLKAELEEVIKWVL